MLLFDDLIMNNPFYARYVPPSSGANIESKSLYVLAGSVKRRKTESGATTIIARKEETAKGSRGAPLAELESVQDQTKRRKKSIREGKKKAKSEASPEPPAPFEGTTAIVASNNANNENKINSDVPEKISAEKIPKLREKKKKRRENVPVEVPCASPTPKQNENSTPSKDSPQVENFKHKKIQAKWEKSALLATRESDLSPDSTRGLAAGEDENTPPTETHGLVPIPQPEQAPQARTKAKASALPDWLAHPSIARLSDTVSFDALSIHPTTLGSLKRKGYENAFAVQASVLPLLLPGPDQYAGDICISAATGSGKTLAYALPLIENLRDRPVAKLRGLIVVPTRELVAQARDYLQICASGSRLQIATAVGSKSIHEEQDQLVERSLRYDPEAYQAEQKKKDDEMEDLMNWELDNLQQRRNKAECLANYVVEYTSKVDILICTPGRLVDHMRSTRGFTLDHVQWLVVDEADRLLDESFQEWIDLIMPALAYQAPLNPMDQQLQIAFHLVHDRKVRKIVLSATMTKDIGKITALQLRRPKMVLLETTQRTRTDEDGLSAEQLDGSIERDIQLPATLVEIAVPVGNVEEKPLHLIQLLEKGNSINSRTSKRRPKPDHTGRPSSPSIERATREPGSDSDSDSSSTSSTSSTSSSDSSRSNSAPPEEQPVSSHGILIFTSNNENALRLARLVTLLRPLWAPLIYTLTKSSTSSSARKTLSSVRTRIRLGQGCILIASDRASRGLDVPQLEHVINYDMPPSVTAYVHRVGRTARAGREGVATTLVAHHEARWFWNEIARNEKIGRGEGRKVRRLDSKGEFTDEEKRSYAEALKVLGREARGEGPPRLEKDQG
jgi:ATP-dependent RNA helicase DDX51/DBP6